MIILRHLSCFFSKVIIFLLVSWSWNCQGLSKRPFNEENGLLKGYHTGPFKLADLLKALSVGDLPETYVDIYNDMPGPDSDDIDDTLQFPFSVKSAYPALWEGMNSKNKKDNEEIFKKNDLNSICQKGNEFGSWLVKLCNDHKSAR